jgi:hypothetical protein
MIVVCGRTSKNDGDKISNYNAFLHYASLNKLAIESHSLSKLELA